MPFAYPIALDLDRRRAVVVGGGPVAEAKARGLLEAGAGVTVVAPHPVAALVELARRGALELEERPFDPTDLDGAVLVIATGNGEENRAVFAAAEARRVLCNAVDDVDHCHFTIPAQVRRGDLVLAISTGGKSPALAKALRVRLETEIGPEYGPLCELLGSLRSELAATRAAVGFSEWALRWQRALEADLAGLVRDGRRHEARDAVVRAVAVKEEAVA